MLWRESQRRQVQELINTLLDHVTADGLQVTGGTRIAQYELAASTRGELSRRDVFHVVTRMAKRNLESAEEFEEVWEEWNQEQQNGSGRPDRWKFYFPTHLDLSHESLPRSTQLYILGVRFYFRTKESVERDWTGTDLGEVLLDAIDFRVKSPPETFITCSVDAHDWRDAYDRISSPFDALRGLLEFVTGWGSWRWGSGIKPRAKVPPPQWVLGKREDGKTEGYRLVRLEYQPTKILTLKGIHLKNFNHFSGPVKQEPERGSTGDLIADALRLYAQALEAHLSYQCFLGFWQLAEAIALGHGRDVGQSEVRKRVQWHLSETDEIPGTGVRYSLQQMVKMRNDLVHRGIHHIEDEDVNQLKWICESALWWLLSHGESLETRKALEEFYRLRTKGSSVLSSVETAIEFVRKTRS